MNEFAVVAAVTGIRSLSICMNAALCCMLVASWSQQNMQILWAMLRT